MEIKIANLKAKATEWSKKSTSIPNLIILGVIVVGILLATVAYLK